MKDRNHIVLATAITFAFGAPIIGIICVMVGSLVPDRMDYRLSLGFEKLFFKVHRGFSHWPWLYLFPIAGLMLLPNTPAYAWKELVGWTCYGALLHILGDMMTPGGVPYLPWSFKKKISFRLFKTGTAKEYLFTWGLALPLLGLGALVIHATGVQAYIVDFQITAHNLWCSLLILLNKPSIYGFQ